MNVFAQQIERPFAAPAEIVHVLDLPCPPSVNALWRSDRGRKPHRSDEYKAWIAAADMAAVVGRKIAGRKAILGKFEAVVRIARGCTKADLDNIGTKALLDWAQSRGFIVNDKHVERYEVRWTDTDCMPNKCRLVLRSVG